MTWWAITAVYALGFLATWRRAAWLAANEGVSTYHPKPDGEDVAWGIFFGAIAAFAWPIIVPSYIIWKRGLMVGPGHAFLKEPGISRRERELREREQNISRLERELGIPSLDERRRSA